MLVVLGDQEGAKPNATVEVPFEEVADRLSAVRDLHPARFEARHAGGRVDAILAVRSPSIVTDPSQAERRFVLFVYGTLLPGEASHSLLDGARALGPAKTPPRFGLYDIGPYPALVAGGATVVAGELYEVTAPRLAAIDVHEQVPLLFKRGRIELADGQLAEAYLLDADQVRGRRRIPSGDWRARFRGAPAPGARDAPFVRWLRNRER